VGIRSTNNSTEKITEGVMKFLTKIIRKVKGEYNSKIEILKLLSSREMYGYEIWREDNI